MATNASFTIRQVAPASTEGSRVDTTEGEAPPEALSQSIEDSQRSDRMRRRSTRRKRPKPEEKKKSRKPPSNRWFQQQIPACRPVWTTRHVVVLFAVISVVFIALGIGFLVTTSSLKNLRVEYTSCEPVNAAELAALTGENFTSCESYLYFRANLSSEERMGEPVCMCQINFIVPDTMDTPVFMYYSLHNYFQNHRRFLNSWSGDQLRSVDLRATGTCDPLEEDNNGETFLPCGVIANSFFNDTLAITPATNLSFERTDISWQSDRDVRFQNQMGNETEQVAGTVRPKNWQRNISEVPNSLQNEDFIVWFRVSAFPNFLKLYARIHGEGGILRAGNYTLQIEYNYPVTRFHGSKYLVLSEGSWLGGKDHFLGIAYIVVGVLSMVAAIAMIIIRVKFSKWRLVDKRVRSPSE